VARHSLGGFIHGLRREVHSLLGEKIVLLALSGFGFAALAGYGAFVVFDDLDRKRDRQRLGRVLHFGGGLLAFLCLLLGPP
jgi:hypothetical protein